LLVVEQEELGRLPVDIPVVVVVQEVS